MLFNSYVFLFAFLPLALAGWWLVPGRNARFAFLTLASYVFYGWWDVRFVPLMILSSSADYLAGGLIARSESQRVRTVWLVSLLVLNLGILAAFKYFDFFAQTFNLLAGAAGSTSGVVLMHVVLPVGISFYTFNSISYTIDIYRRRLPPARNILQFSAFVAMFPHLVAGPIIRYDDMAAQFDALPTRPRQAELVVGLWLFVIGMAKKILLADPIARNLVAPYFDNPAGLGAATAWVTTLGYTLQIYFDFSGYSDMAVGLAFMLGLRYPQNFNSPYQAGNISEFWRRWHMSLSLWLRDYLFIPLGGSRGSSARTARNLIVTVFLGGLWHGAAWTFALWGLYHGALLAGHAKLKEHGWLPRSKSLGVASTFLAVMVGWVFFRSRTLGGAWRMCGALVGARGLENLSQLRQLVTMPRLLLIPVGLLIVFLAPNTWRLRYPRSAWSAVLLAATLLLCATRFGTWSPFLYFQF